MPARDFICISSVRWDSMRQRMQALMDELSRSRRVLYVEPPAVIDVAMLHAGMRAHLRTALKGLRGEGNLRIFAPTMLSLTQRDPLHAFCQRSMRGQIGRAARALGFERPVVWTYFYPGFSVDALPDGDVAYDCVDDPALHALFAGRRTGGDKALAQEKALAARARWVFATARRLVDQLRAVNPAAHWLPNAAASDAPPSCTPEPPDMASIPRPIAGFIGAIAPWVDLALVEEIAARLPHVSFVLVGPVLLGARVEGLCALPNVHLLGARPHEEMPRYLSSFSVCLIPFLLNEITLSVNPIKFWEYLAAGKPIVATRLPELDPYSSLVDLRDDPEAFADAIAARVANPDSGRDERLELARLNTWRQRVDALLGVIERD